MDIYDKIEAYRKRENITNKEMANKLGYNNESSYRMAICRKSRVSLNTLKEIISVLNLSDDDILDLFK